MLISERLKAIVELVEYNSIADIGTDHAHLPIYFCSHNQGKAIACDINKGPLERAKENIIKSGLDTRIETRLGSGLEIIEPFEVETVVISGMGGAMIISILHNRASVVSNLKQLILQPQHNIPDVRMYVHTIGFKISTDIVIYEDGKYYNIINCQKGEDVLYNKEDYLTGKNLTVMNDEVLVNYYEYELNRLKRIKNELRKNCVAEREIEIDELIGMYSGKLKTVRQQSCKGRSR